MLREIQAQTTHKWPNYVILPLPPPPKKKKEKEKREAKWSLEPSAWLTWSRMSARLVAASMMTPSCVPMPSISTSSWFNVCSSSTLDPKDLNITTCYFTTRSAHTQMIHAQVQNYKKMCLVCLLNAHKSQKNTILDLFNVWQPCSIKNYSGQESQNNLQLMILTYLWPWNKVKVIKPGMNCQTPARL